MASESSIADKSAFEPKILQLCKRLSNEDHPLNGLQRLTGGANMETWSIDYGPHKWVMRRMPENFLDDEYIDDGGPGIDLPTEEKVIQIAIDNGVTAPAVIGGLYAKDGLGTGFIMQRIAGETLPHKILKQPEYEAARESFTRQCAEELAKIHSLPQDVLPDDVPTVNATNLLKTLVGYYKEYGATLPVFDLALNWLAQNIPTSRPGVYVHGDFRIGNLMIDNQGLASVLDWEQGHIGDPAFDLAYLCTPSWRFGNYEKPVGGIGQIEDLLKYYNEFSGQEIPMADIRFWIVFSSLKWGLATIKMINLWRTGQDRSLERSVIGRRTSETEIDLLLALEEDLGVEPGTQKLEWPESLEFCGSTAVAELLDALIEWDEEAVMPSATDRNLFQARVARNAMQILRREQIYGPTFARNNAERLRNMGMDENDLAKRLSTGELTEDMLRHLRLDLLERISIDQPKYAGFHVAKMKWLTN